MAPHPLDQLSLEETSVARNVDLQAYPNSVVQFREILLQEPPRELLKKLLAAERKRNDNVDVLRPPRQALCQYDVVGSSKFPSGCQQSAPRFAHNVSITEFYACFVY